jgi:sugar phosphate isomerase/epimerase
MEFGVSTQFYRNQPVTVDLLEALRRAGYNRFELFCNRPHFDFHDRGLMRSVGRWFEENRLPPPSMHLPFLEGSGTDRRWISALEPERRHRAAAIDEIKRSLELADWIRPEYVVLHLGNPGEPFNPVAFEYAFAVIFQIRHFSGVNVMLENIPNGISTIERIQEFRRVSDLPDVGICYDTGHGHLQGTPGDLNFVDATHIHDNLGERDDHLWPFDGKIDWPALIEKLVLAKYSGHFVFEARGDDIHKGAGARSRLLDLWQEAHDSIEEYRVKYKLVKNENN